MAREVLNSGVYLGYDGVANSLRTSEDQQYQVWFDKSETHGSLRAESIASAKAIRESTDKEIVVLYSGGMDSEWVLESFRLANIPVTALCVVYAHDLNKHDVDWARKYLTRNNHPSVIYHHFDLEAWYKSEAIREMGLRVQTPELAYTAQYQSILENRTDSRVFITSYDEPLLIGNDEGPERVWDMTYSERHYSVVKFFEAYEIDGCSNWSRQSASLFAAFVTQPQWKMLAHNLYAPPSWNSELVKIPMFQSWFPKMEARAKYTGFEGSLDFVVDAGAAWRKHLKEDLGATWMQESVERIQSVWSKL